MNTSLHFLRSVSVSTLLISSNLHAYNLISNCDFSAGETSWQLTIGDGTSATFDQPSWWGRVEITAGGSSKGSVTLKQNLALPLASGDDYTVSFKAKAGATKTIDALIRSQDGIILGGTYSITLGSNPASYTFSYKHSGVATGANLCFRVGGNTVPFFVDDVIVTRTGKNSQLMTKNADGIWEFPTKELDGKWWNLGAYDFSYAGYWYGEREEFTGIPSTAVTLNVSEGQDITAALNQALTNLPNGGTVKIPAGIFRIGSNKTGNAIIVQNDNTVIKGAPNGGTILKIASSYRSSSGNAADRQTASFSSGVVRFAKPDYTDWNYLAITSTVTQPISFGARTIQVASAAALEVGDNIVITQIMWPDFVIANAYDLSAYPTAPYRWTNYKDGIPSFTDRKHSFSYFRKVTSKSGNVVQIDIPIPRALNPLENRISVSRVSSPILKNCGLQDLTFATEPDGDAALSYKSIGSVISMQGLYNGLFKNVKISSFRSLGFVPVRSVNVTFLNCVAANALNCGGGGAGYGFYINGQNMLYKNCSASNVRHGYTTAESQTSNIVVKNCSSFDFHFNPDEVDGGEAVDDTHLRYAHGILYDNHYSSRAGLLMVNRGRLSKDAYETCGWAVIWNYENEGFKTLDAGGNNMRHSTLGITPTEFGLVIGAHSGGGPNGLSVLDGYSRFPSFYGVAITSQNVHVGSESRRVLYELTGTPVAESLYDIQFKQRSRMLPAE